MRSEDGLRLEVAEALEAVGRADVLVLGFTHLSPRVLFDTRKGAGRPLFRLVPPVRTPEERFAQLRRLRPGLPDPERFVFIQWPLGLDSLLETGLWERIVSHCSAAAGERGIQDCAGVLSRLRMLDRKEEREAIGGESYRTLWPLRRDRGRGGR